jgi:SAM-dependent methyltransferase
VTGEPSPPKGLDGIDPPDHGLCLDVACGLGEQSLWAAERGFDVIALDVSPLAITALQAAAEDRHLTDRIDARVVDLDDGLSADLDGQFALVICQRFRDPRLYPSLVGAAIPGGLVVVTVLSRVGATSPGPFHAPPGELESAFRALPVDIVHHAERGGEATIAARRVS